MVQKLLRFIKTLMVLCFISIAYFFFQWILTLIYHSNQLHRLTIQHETAVVELRQALLYIQQCDSNDFLKLKLMSAINALSSETTVSDYDEKDVDMKPLQLNLNTAESTSFYACPETFLHAKYGHPHFMYGSWIVTNCTAPKRISEVLSIVLMTSDYNSCAAINKTVLGIRRLLPKIRILLGVSKKFVCKLNVTLDVIKVKSSKLGVKLNKLISCVTTPLVLIGRHLDYFDWFARIKRQLSAFSIKPGVDIVGGSVRNKSGHFQVGCFQSKLKYYKLQYIDGYYKSKNECMFCDYLLGPFIAKSELIREIEFDEVLNDEVVFEDFFLRVKTAGKMVINCPDAMYQASDPGIAKRLETRETWLSLVLKFRLNRIVLPNGVVRKFSCDESSISCELLYVHLGAKMMPICCRDAFINGYRVFHEFAVKNKVFYQIEGGSILGAVKFGDVMPWDLDGDGSYYKDKKHLFSEKLDWSNSRGKIYVDNINLKGDGFFYVSPDKAYIEFYAVDNLSVDAIEMHNRFREKPTLVRIGDVWVYAPPSPGLYSRNYYGREMLKHSNSYSQLGRKHWYDPYNASDSFLVCKEQHHACLDQFTQDGSIQFKIP